MRRHSIFLSLLMSLSLGSLACDDLFVDTNTTSCTKKVAGSAGVIVFVGNKQMTTGTGGTITYTVPAGQSCDSVPISIPGGGAS